MSILKRTSRPPKRGSRRPRRNPEGAVPGLSSTTFVERIDDVAGHLQQPGRYYTTTGQQAFVVAKSLSWHPLVLPGEDTFFPEGTAFHWTVLPEERNVLTDVLPPEVLDEKVEIEQLTKAHGELAQPLDMPERNRRMRRNAGESLEWGVTENYFIDSLGSYGKWESAFWRELLQNSRDAGSSRIDLTCEEASFTDPETGLTTQSVMCICRDNGSGMDKDTLVRAFFTRGGSAKPAGAVGGFGDAKELILVPWLGYEVRTRDLKAVGHHQRLVRPIESGQPFMQGTEVKVWMPLTTATSAVFAQTVLEKSNLPNVTVKLNGERVDAKLIGGEKVRDIPISATTFSVNWTDARGTAREVKFSYEDEFYEFMRDLSRQGLQYRSGQQTRQVGRMEIWHQKRAKRHGCYVRGSGVFMFERQIDSNIKGAVFVDIFAPPRGVFTRKRDTLDEASSARRSLDGYLDELAVDPMSALKKERAQRDKLKTIFTGSGPIDVREGVGADVADDMRRRRARAAEVGAQLATQIDLEQVKEKKGEVELVDVEIKRAMEILVAVLDQAEQAADKAGGPNLTPLPEGFEAIVKGGSFVNKEQLAGALQFAAWKPDLFVYQNLDNWKMSNDFHPMTMKPKYLRLLRLWAELCKYALVRLGMFKPFGVGWVFDTEKDRDGKELVIGAGYLRQADCDWLLINPVKMERKPDSSDEFPEYEVTGDHYDLSSERAIKKLCASVIHEVTHMQGFSKHDQSYAYQLTDNIEIAFDMERAAKKILKGVNRAVREEVRERREAEAAEAQVPWNVIYGKVVLALSYIGKLYYSELEKIAEGKTSVPQLVREVESKYSRSPSWWEPAIAGEKVGLIDRTSYSIPGKVVLRLYEALRLKDLVPALSDDDANYAAGKAGRLPPDPRAIQKGETPLPENLPVFNVIKRTGKEGQEWVIREGYYGLRGVTVGAVKTFRGADVYRGVDEASEFLTGKLGQDALWLAWVQDGNSFRSVYSRRLQRALRTPTYSYVSVTEAEPGTDYSIWPSGLSWWQSSIQTAAPGGEKYGITSMAAAQAYATNRIAEHLKQESEGEAFDVAARGAAVAQRKLLPIPNLVNEDVFVKLFPLWIVSVYAVPAETLTDRSAMTHATRELAGTWAPHQAAAFGGTRDTWGGERKRIPMRDEVMDGVLETLGRDLIREWFQHGGVDFDNEDMMRGYTEVVANTWDLKGTPLALSAPDGVHEMLSLD